MSKPRFEGREFWALVAQDTFDPIAERISAILTRAAEEDRRMVLISRYVNKTGADNLDIKVGLRLDAEYGDPITIRSGASGSRSFHASLGPGSHGFGFTAEADSVEERLHQQWDERADVYGREVTRVHVDGWATTPSREDRIDIERWNENRVGILSTLVFQANWG